jgi:N-acetylmuramic acid 6-phosphate (MurNAc-6-P) etherase
VKTAIVMGRRRVEPEEARRRLALARGLVRRALAR